MIKNIVQNCNDLYSKKLLSSVVTQLNSKELQMFDAIKLNSEITDKDLVKIIYDKDSPSYTTYQKLKTTLREKLFTLELLSINGSRIQIIKKSIYQRQLVVRSLELRGYKPGVLKLAKLCRRDAVEYQMYDVAMDMCRLLCNYYSTYECDMEVADKYNEERKLSMTLYARETEAEYKYDMCICLAQQKRTIDTELADKVKVMISQIQLDNDSHRLHFYYYMMKLVECEFRGDIDGKIENCKSALSYFEKLYFRHNRILSIFRNRLIAAYINQGNLALAETLAHFELTQDDKTDYQRILLTHKLCWIQSRLGKYQDALTTISKVSYSKINIPTFKERYIIDRMILQLATGDLANISLTKIKNSTPIAQSDKTGLGLIYLIAECIYHIMRGKAHLVEDDDNGNIAKHIELLDHKIHAKQINLLNFMMGIESNLDESKCYISEELKIIPLDILKSLVLR